LRGACVVDAAGDERGCTGECERGESGEEEGCEMHRWQWVNGFQVVDVEDGSRLD